MTKRAVVVLSGGLDSTTCMAIAKNEGYELYALSFDYGQRHRIELISAKRVAIYFGAKKHLVLHIPLRPIGGSCLTDDIDVPKNRDIEEMSSSIPLSYVPGRNIIFLSFATSWAEKLGISDIFTGVNVLDYSGYPDCRPEFIKLFNLAINRGTKAGAEGRLFTIHTPLIDYNKSSIIKIGMRLGVDYSITHSCYDPDKDGNPCGKCDSCLLRMKGFQEAGLVDPLFKNL